MRALLAKLLPRQGRWTRIIMSAQHVDGDDAALGDWLVVVRHSYTTTGFGQWLGEEERAYEVEYIGHIHWRDTRTGTAVESYDMRDWLYEHVMGRRAVAEARKARRP